MEVQYDPLMHAATVPDMYMNTPIGKDIHNWDVPQGVEKVYVPAENKYPDTRSTNIHPDDADHYFYYDYNKISRVKGAYANKQGYDLPAARWGPSNSIPITESELVLAQRVQLLLLVAAGAIGISMII